jgi:hypothetical protein
VNLFMDLPMLVLCGRIEIKLEIGRWVSGLEKSNKSIIRSNVDAILNPEVEFSTDMNSSDGEE